MEAATMRDTMSFNEATALLEVLEDLGFALELQSQYVHDVSSSPDRILIEAADIREDDDGWHQREILVKRWNGGPLNGPALDLLTNRAKDAGRELRHDINGILIS